MASNDTSDQEESASMISVLLPENVEKIFSYLEFHNLYNCSKACQRWNKIAHDVAWRGKKNEDKKCGSKCACFVLPIDLERMEKITRNGQPYTINTNMSEIESAARLVTAGLIEELNYMTLVKVDLRDMPVNIMNNFAKVVKKSIVLKEVKGFHIKMFEDVKCDRLVLERMSIDASNLTDTICIRGLVELDRIGGDICQLLDHIETKEIMLSEYTLDEKATRSLTQMLRDRVTELFLSNVNLKDEVLTEYDGSGMCQYIRVRDYGNQPEIHREIVKYFETWVGNKSRWIMKDLTDRRSVLNLEILRKKEN